jgi:hypothetical protein
MGRYVIVSKKRLRKLEKKVDLILKVLKAAETPEETKVPEEPAVAYTDPVAQALREVREKLGMVRDEDLETEISYETKNV